ncbi:MAG TPA: hypothetical protein VF414_18980, partial [Thermoanaerobaculia bacterium]
RRGQFGLFYGGATYLAETVDVLPLLTAVLAAVLSLDGVTREQSEGAWSTVSLTEISAAGYLLRRWIALLAVILPVTAAPLLAVFGFTFAAGTPVSTEALAAAWLTGVVPMAVAASGLSLALGTIGGGTINAFLLLAGALWLAPALLNSLLGRFGLLLEGPADALALDRWGWAMSRLTSRFEEGRFLLYPYPASEAGFDPGVTAEQLLTPLALGLAWGAAALGVATLYLRRTRPDLRTWRIPPKHPLRSFLAALSRLRERAVPDPAPAPADRLAVALGLLAMAGLLALVLVRADRYTALALTRFHAEKSGGPKPTSPTILPGRWRIAGRLGPGSKVDLTVAAELHNTGPAPERHLAFELNPRLAVDVAAGRGQAAVSRTWDRLTVDLDPPLSPGERRELRFRLSGRPAVVAFPSRDGVGFFRSMSWHVHARFSRELLELTRSYEVPAISGLRVDLAATDLTPVLRYRPWTTTEEHLVPEETFSPLADVELSLAARPGLFLVESCGGRFRRDGRAQVRCRQPLGDVAVAGGRYQVLKESGGATVAVFPSHRRQGEMHLGFLAQSAQMVEQAWPGLGDLGSLVVLEWPDPTEHDLNASRIAWRNRYGYANAPQIFARGGLAFIPERLLIDSKPVPPEGMVAELVKARLARRRALAPEDKVFFEMLFYLLSLRRLGTGPTGGAVIGPFGMDIAATLSVPPPDTRDHNYWYQRFPALVAALEIRTGEAVLRGAIDDLLARNGDRSATRGELFDLLKARSPAPVERMIRDYFVDGSIPEPVLENVLFRRAGGLWRATGQMRNQGYGEALCRVVLATDLTPAETVVSAGTGETTAFSLESPYRPQAVLLDPDRQCHRVVAKGAAKDRVNFQGEAP